MGFKINHKGCEGMEKNFVKETKSELKKVIWPSRQQVASGTGVVIAMVAIVGIIILCFDFISGLAIQEILKVNQSESQIILDEYDHSHEEDVVDDVTDTNNTDVIPDSNTEGNVADVTENGSAE